MCEGRGDRGIMIRESPDTRHLTLTRPAAAELTTRLTSRFLVQVHLKNCRFRWFRIQNVNV